MLPSNLPHSSRLFNSLAASPSVFALTLKAPLFLPPHMVLTFSFASAIVRSRSTDGIWISKSGPVGSGPAGRSDVAAGLGAVESNSGCAGPPLGAVIWDHWQSFVAPRRHVLALVQP